MYFVFINGQVLENENGESSQIDLMLATGNISSGYCHSNATETILVSLIKIETVSEGVRGNISTSPHSFFQTTQPFYKRNPVKYRSTLDLKYLMLLWRDDSTDIN